MMPNNTVCKAHPNNKGFSIIELIVVIAILMILITVAVVSYNSVEEKAKENVLAANTSTVAQLVALYTYDYDKSLWYGAWNDDGDGTLNNFLELELEVINEGTYENNISLANPYSGKKSILDYDKTLGSGDGFCPAVFLTANQSYSHAGSGSTDNILGTIVVFFNVSDGETENIEIFHIKKNGDKSEDPTILR